tara:strand:- start:449 stop:718 length:270 start_codon:yes stop_codon:yes gene_type:complete
MLNEQDYQAGWTTPIQHPITGNMCYGGAARNVRSRMAGGNCGVFNMGYLTAFNSLQPIINSYQAQLQDSQECNQKMALFISQMQARKSY